MPDVPYWHVDAFASEPFTGNQAAVMILDDWPEDDVLRRIGNENNFAETAFLVRDHSGDSDWELRWFTPTDEIRLCGHATLASGHVLLGLECHQLVDIVVVEGREFYEAREDRLPRDGVTDLFLVDLQGGCIELTRQSP